MTRKQLVRTLTGGSILSLMILTAVVAVGMQAREMNEKRNQQFRMAKLHTTHAAYSEKELLTETNPHIRKWHEKLVRHHRAEERRHLRLARRPWVDPGLCPSNPDPPVMDIIEDPNPIP